MANKKIDIDQYLAAYFMLQLLQGLNSKPRDYSNSFHNFDESAVQITKNFGNAILSKRNSNEEKTYYCTEWIRQVSTIYGIEPPGLEFRPEEEGSSYYNVKKHLIVLRKKVSLVTLLHEFRHAMQHKGIKMIDPDVEEDARAWSMSLFKKALPKAHENAVKKKLVHYI